MTDISTNPLWTPDERRVRESSMEAFRQWCAYNCRTELSDHEALHRWSVNEPMEFWRSVWDFCNVKGFPGARTLVDGDDILRARFFPDAKLNFAQNLLSLAGIDDALVFRGENKIEYRWSWDHLRSEVSRLQQALRKMGVSKGDRVAAMLPNMPEAIACMLAASSIGAIWASCSPDIGIDGVLDRFGQIEPKLVLTCDAYWYGSKLHDVSGKVRDIEAKLRCPVLVVPYAGDAEGLVATLADGRTYQTFVDGILPREIDFALLPFSHPLYILFSSGTTGVPKCIVHSAGGTLLQHVKEHRLHCDIKPNDRVFFFTTCAWMMWNWLASALSAKATLCLYDGSPFASGPEILWEYAAEERFTFFGTSAKYLDGLRKIGFLPKNEYDLSALRVVASTGSPLSDSGFEYVYTSVKSDVQVASISGGTDIVSCFVLGNPVLPVWSGEIQGAGLGLAVDIWDDRGVPVRELKGDLVCTKPFPSMPIGFWNDPDNAKYRASYFERFDNVWCHGDYAEWTSHGGMIIYGRSDATLNPGGVRIGTAEIYNQVELLPEVQEAVCVGQDFDGDVRVLLFVKLVGDTVLDDLLANKIKQKVRFGASPRHVPSKILQVNEIPKTKSGKVVELAVRNTIHGKPVLNQNTLENPQSLLEYERLREQLTY